MVCLMQVFTNTYYTHWEKQINAKYVKASSIVRSDMPF